VARRRRKKNSISNAASIISGYRGRANTFGRSTTSIYGFGYSKKSGKYSGKYFKYRKVFEKSRAAAKFANGQYDAVLGDVACLMHFYFTGCT
jgi:hypothetical protein